MARAAARISKGGPMAISAPALIKPKRHRAVRLMDQEIRVSFRKIGGQWKLKNFSPIVLRLVGGDFTIVADKRLCLKSVLQTLAARGLDGGALAETYAGDIYAFCLTVQKRKEKNKG